MTLLAVADFLVKWGKEIEGDVGGLEIFGIGVGDVVSERSEGGGSRRRNRIAADGERCGVYGCE